jgi:hypothetical protein
MRTETFHTLAQTVIDDLHEEHPALEDQDPEIWAKWFCERFVDAAEELAE